MTNEEKLKANMAAAEIVGHNIKSVCNVCRVTFPVDWDACTVLECGNTDMISTTFDIFNNPADRMTVVKALGERFGIYIFHTHQEYPEQGWTWESVNPYMLGTIHKEYEEAVAAAVLEVEDD